MTTDEVNGIELMVEVSIFIKSISRYDIQSLESQPASKGDFQNCTKLRNYGTGRTVGIRQTEFGYLGPHLRTVGDNDLPVSEKCWDR